MKRHETPHSVATALLRHAPRTIHALLDPAVGTGNLIAPLVGRLSRSLARVYCIDSDQHAVRVVSRAYDGVLPLRSKFIHSDFLSWSKKSRARFGCIVMNPPFAATKDRLYQVNGIDALGKRRKVTRFVPLEAAFVHSALRLLEERGRLLAVLPCSVVMADTLQWLRDEMLSMGTIRFVHELPPRSFPGVESRMYLMVFEKGVRRRHIELLNHDLHEPERFALPLKGHRITRLDYGFVKGMDNLARLRKYEWLEWTPLRQLADVLRGDIPSPRGPRYVVHSTDYSGGFWRGSTRHNSAVSNMVSRRIQRGDLLVTRVGRGACTSVGRGIGVKGMACSDCVLIVRPKKANSMMKVLFALRAILSQDWARPLVERGTGASYISHDSLLDLPIPMGVCVRHSGQFKKFAEAERAGASDKSRRAVRAVVKRLKHLLGNSPNNGE